MTIKIIRSLLVAIIGLLVITIGWSVQEARAQQVDDFKYTGSLTPLQTQTIQNDIQFNGYTRYWHDDYRRWFRYGNLFKMSVPNVQKTLLQSKIDIAEDLGLPGLFLEEGFLNGLLTEAYTTLHQPSPDQINNALNQGKNILVYVDPASEAGSKLAGKLPPVATSWRKRLGAHQYNASDINIINAFYLQAENEQRLFVVLSSDSTARQRLEELIAQTQQVVTTYDLRKGMFGVKTLLKSVTSTPGHPLDVIGKGMNAGASWFVFNGYMGFRMKKNRELQNWLGKVNLPIVTDLGVTPIFGCSNYDGFQVQVMTHLKGKKAWVNYARQHNCYIFRRVYDPAADSFRYDGYMARAGNKGVIDTSSVPFVLQTGPLQENLLRSMVLFIPKGKPFTRKQMWAAILHRRAVGILKQGKMIGSAKYRHPLEMLLLDHVFLEEYFEDKINIQANVKNYTLNVTVQNAHGHAVNGKLRLTLPPELKLKESLSTKLSLPAGKTKHLQFNIQPKAGGMDKTNPIAVHFNWNDHKKSTLTKLDLPPAISVHRLLYGTSPEIKYPVTIHNFTKKQSFPVNVRVYKKGEKAKPVYQASQSGTAPFGRYQDMMFKLKVPPGQYKVKVSALGQNYSSQLGVGEAEKKGEGARAYRVDLNNDGTDEYRLENDSVQVTLLATGARIIQYIVKSQDDNAFFKLWPQKPVDATKAYRKRRYYPYGGFEDFLGQPSIETHKVYNARIIKKKGDYVRVRMSADYYGNTITKTFTLYGNSPLVGVRFALNFINPALNMIGPQPMLQLGENHGPEDVFIVPTRDSLRRVRPTGKLWGLALDLKQGWNAGYDTSENLSWVGAYPVSQPLFLHLWMNTPANGASHYAYTELQPWTPIYEKSTMYFSYYMWGAGGPWKEGLKALRKRNLITEH